MKEIKKENSYSDKIKNIFVIFINNRTYKSKL